eukprot:gene27603-33336_t
MSTFEVQLAVYDLSRGMARAMSQSILGQQIEGIWHTGIVVYGKEYYFGGGIQVTPWGVFARSHNMPPTEVRSLGWTSKTQNELEAYLRSISSQFTSMTYDLINNNCNNFSDTVSRFLLGQGIPSYIIDLPRTVFSTPGGAMLRPMIEGMQNQVRTQHAHGLDPFATAPASQQPAASFETALSESVTSLVMNVSAQQQQAAVVTRAPLEEQPLVSADAGSVSALINKLINLPSADGEKGGALSNDMKDTLRGIAQTLASPSQANVTFTTDQYAVMEEILAQHPEGHMAVLFVVRVMFLHDKLTDFSRLSLVKTLLSRLLQHTGQGEGEAFASIPAHVMALCSIANLLSHSGGLALLAASGGDTSDSSSNASSVGNDGLGDMIVDIVLGGWGHGRGEVRVMASTLAYNYTLSNTKENQLSGVWKAASEQENGLHPQAMQLLCASLEGLENEVDRNVRKRKLSVVCRILRAYGGKEGVAGELVKDLGLDSSVRGLKRSDVTKDETVILEEVLSYL